MTRSGGALTDDPNPATILRQKAAFGLRENDLGVPKASLVWWFSWESLSNFKHESSFTSSHGHSIKHMRIGIYICIELLNAKLRILKLDLLSGAL